MGKEENLPTSEEIRQRIRDGNMHSIATAVVTLLTLLVLAYIYLN